MKERNKSNNNYRKIWWGLLIAGTLSASASQKIIYNIAYKIAYYKAYDEVYDETYDKVYDEVWSETLNRGIKEKGYHVELGPDYCTDFGLLHEADKTAAQEAGKTATQEANKIVTQKAETTANRTLDAGAFIAIAGLFGLLATNKKSKEL